MPYFLPAFFMSVLACWLGLSLLVRAPRDRGAQAFAWFCYHLTLYGLAIVLGDLTRSPSVSLVVYRVELAETAILPPVFLHFVIVATNVSRGALAQRALLGLSYGVGVVLAGYALLSPSMDLTGPTPRFPTGPLIFASIVQRALPLLLAVLLTVLSYQWTNEDRTIRRQRAFFASAVSIAVIGALLAAAARELRFTTVPGHTLMDIGLALLAYTVLAYRMLLPARVAQRAFYRALLGGIFTAIYPAVLLLVEPVISSALAINTLLITVFAIVILLAVFAPLRDGVGLLLDRRFFRREFDYGQLLRAVSEDLVERGDLAGRLEAALTAICRTLDVSAGVVAVREEAGLRVLVTYGVEQLATDALQGVPIPDQPQTLQEDWEPWTPARLLLPLRNRREALGLLALGPKRSAEPYEEVERVLLSTLCSHLASEIKHARTQQESRQAMAAIVEQSRQLEAAEQALAAQVAEHERLVATRQSAPPIDIHGLRVFALGPLRVEQDGVPIERWGGDKAGTYQAEALFAFLFDRRGRGVTKDEAEEVIWPDLDMRAIEKADTAFHRTLSGLRRTLEPGLRRGNQSRLITYHHERYWLDPTSISWSDVDTFAAAIERGYTLLRQDDIEGALASFRQAVSLYRADYMDDCPFFGDSSYVEDRRVELRDQYIDALLALGEIYERLGQTGEAITSYRRATTVSLEECPRAEDALTRLQAERLEAKK